MSVEMSYEDLPDGVVRVTLEIDAQLLLEVHEDVARILVRDLLRNALLQRQQGMRQRPISPDPRDAFDALAYSLRPLVEGRTPSRQEMQDRNRQNQENRARYYEELRRLMAESSAFTEEIGEIRRGRTFGFDAGSPFEPWVYGAFASSTPARGCDSHIFTDPACAACTAIQAKSPKKRKLNPKHPLNALDGERE